MHSVHKVVCGLLLVLLFHIFEVHGTFYYNGLVRYGKNVCERRISKTISTTVVVTTVKYKTYYTKCGFLWLGRCKRSRTVYGYRNRWVYYQDYDTYLFCCSGWRKSGYTCPIAICSRPCKNGGFCASPNKCSCRIGWTGSDCSEDVNDCLTNNGGCQQQCFNIPGRGVICKCARGYTSSGKKCHDVNECSRPACSCAVTGSGNKCGATCRNTPGSFSCSCGQGYHLKHKTVCRDDDECYGDNGGCSHLCVNYLGGYRCSCRKGFRLMNDKMCEDVNECENNNGYCQHTCQNLYGGHRCKCKEGFTLDSNKRTCSDIDECHLGYDMHGCQHHCNNTLGGFYCSCRKGYKLTRNNRTCTDIDECAPRSITGSNHTATLSTCHHICSNVEGSFLCSCRKGYMLMYDKKRCRDVDECQTGQHTCEHKCHNTDGSYRCTCNAGYKLLSDGRTCKGQPCEDISPPWQGTMTCFGKVTDTNCTFSCNPGYDLVGSKFRTCFPSSRWSGNQTWCKAKHCETLTTTRENETLSVPCFTSLGSTCFFGCRPGFVLKGEGQANCSLDIKSGALLWNIGKFSCEVIKTCKPNPCKNEGKCFATDDSFVCNCEQTGYKGKHCEIGYIRPPVFPKLRPNIQSKNLLVLAHPSKRLRVSLNANDGVTFNPQSIEIQFPQREGAFTVGVAAPGIRAVTYTLKGENAVDFETPDRSVVFAAPEISNKNTNPFELMGKLAVGCLEHEAKEVFSCPLLLVSTAPWEGTPGSTNGMVHLATSNNQTIPLSLIGLNLNKMNVSRDYMIDTGIAKTSTSKNFSLLHQRNGKCYSQTADSNNLLELIDNDAFGSGIMQALSQTAPDWLTLTVNENNEYFDILNIAVTVESNLEHCSGFPLSEESSLVYYRPTVDYKVWVGQKMVPLFADGRTCFAMSVCKPGFFINFPKEQAKLLKSTLTVFRDMKECCEIDLTMGSIGFLKDSKTSSFLDSVIWNGLNLHRLPSFSYNAWLKGSVHWKMQIPKLLLVTFKMTGEAFMKSTKIDSLLTDRMSHPMEIQFKGEVFVNITTRVLAKDFSLEFGSSMITGKAMLGGKTTCDKNIQGIFITLEGRSSRSLLSQSPLSNYILPTGKEPARLAILVSLSGGRQNRILNIDELKLFLKDISSLIPKLNKVILKAKSILTEVEAVLEDSLEKAEELGKLVQEMEIVTGPRVDVARALTILKQINNNVEFLKKIIEHISPMAFSSGDFSLLRMVFEIQMTNFPKPLEIRRGGEQVATNLQGISFHLRSSLCIGQLCFTDLSSSVEYLAEKNCISSNVPHFPMFRAKGKVLKKMPLSDGNILTLPRGRIIEMLFPRDSGIVSTHFVGDVQLFGVKRSVNVTLNKKRLWLQVQGEIFNKHASNMSVTAETSDTLAWRSLSFTVDGRMSSSSLLAKSLQTRVINYAKHLAKKAAKRVENCKQSIFRAKRRMESAKALVEEQTSSFKNAELEKQEKVWKFKNMHSKYKNKKEALNPSLTKLVALINNKTCDIQNCSYIATNACIPAVCQEEVFVSYIVPNCIKKEKELQVRQIVQEKVEEIEYVPKYKVVHHSTCGGNVFKVIKEVFTGCDSYERKVQVGYEEIKHTATRNAITSETLIIEEFQCGQPKIETVLSGYKEPRECCKNEESGNIRVLDPKCIAHNLNCLTKMQSLKIEIKRLNESLYEDFQAMRKGGQQAAIAQMEASKARVKFDMAKKQLELARAGLKQSEFTKESINLTKVLLREKLGLNLSDKMKNLGERALVTVESLAFSVTMTKSSTKTRLPLTAHVKTFEGLNKEIQFSMDFNNEADSLTIASRRIVETLFGTSRSRRRRSAEQESKKNSDASLLFAENECLFAHEANIFFADIVESLLFAINSKRNLEETMSAGIKSLETLFAPKESPGEFFSGPQQQIRGLFSDTVQSIKHAQLNSSGTSSWSNTLDKVLGFLDILSQEKNFTECSGVQDCADFFFDRLGEMYEIEYHPRAIEIKTMLQTLERIINSLLNENQGISTLEDLISEAKQLIANSTDDIILCGKKPEIERSPPVHVITILGDSVNLECEAKSTLEVEYLWIKDDQPLDETNNSTFFELQNVTKQSEGAYKCQASNRRGSTVSNVTIVEVHQKPNITEQPRDIQGLVGDEIHTVICNSTGVPVPITEWFFIPMKAEKYEVVRVNTTTPYLTLSNLTTADAGFYYCNVSNMHGTIQSRMARLDVIRFVPGVPRMAASLKLRKVTSDVSPKNERSHCEGNSSHKCQQEESAAIDYIIQKMLERLNWPVEKVNRNQKNGFPNAPISFVVHGDDSPTILEGNKLEALFSFSQSRRRLGNGLRKLCLALKDEGMQFKWKSLSFVPDTESLVFNFLPQWCPNGTERHENGYLCVYCPPGFHRVANGTCLKCPVGAYQPDEGSTECVKCPFRLSHTEPGAVRESQCIDISIPCKPPAIATKNAQARENVKSLYRSGDTVVFGCKYGYRAVGNGTQECNEGNWTKLDFYCEKTCFPPWKELKKRCYLVIESKLRRWKDTFSRCRNLGSQMVTVSSEEENQFTGKLVKVYLKEKKLGNVRVWLGLRKLHAKAQFQWVDGRPLEGYTNWAPEEPNNDNGRELCSEMYVTNTYWPNTWYDVDCGSSLYRTVTVCEKPLRESD